jgi:hypothetical protein
MHTISKAAYEGDIVSRLRNWRGLHLAHGGDLFEEAADEIESLRKAITGIADQDATLSVCNDNVTVTMDATLTDAEREAIAACVADDEAATAHERADTLRGLLTRTK